MITVPNSASDYHYDTLNRVVMASFTMKIIYIRLFQKLQYGLSMA